MITYFPNKYVIWPVFLSVYVILRSNVSNVLYKLHYIGGVVITLKVRHCQSNHISSFNNLDVSLMLPPAVRSNAPVRLKVQFSKQWYDGIIGTIPWPQPPALPWVRQRGVLEWLPPTPIQNTTILPYLYIPTSFYCHYILYQYKNLLTVYIWILEP